MPQVGQEKLEVVQIEETTPNFCRVVIEGFAEGFSLSTRVLILFMAKLMRPLKRPTQLYLVISCHGSPSRNRFVCRERPQFRQQPRPPFSSSLNSARRLPIQGKRNFW